MPEDEATVPELSATATRSSLLSTLLRNPAAIRVLIPTGEELPAFALSPDGETLAASDADAPSSYWQEELANFEYMLDASPLIIEKLRHHTHHITGGHVLAEFRNLEFSHRLFNRRSRGQE